MRFGFVPKEVPVNRDLTVCAPKFEEAVRLLLKELPDTNGFETLRTEARQHFLYGFGRDYDDGRGKVTEAVSALTSWHGFGLACDVVQKDATPWDAPEGFWDKLGACARRLGLAWGGDWKRRDLPHVQWGRCPKSPTDADRQLYRQQGIEAVWVKYGAA